MFIQLFSIFWAIFTFMTAIDFTIIGHIKNWKRIKCWKWLYGAIPYRDWQWRWIGKSHWYGVYILNDQTTHPQVLWFVFGAFLYFLGIIGLIIGVWQFINDVDAWVLWLIDAVLYIPCIILRIIFKLHTKKVYNSFAEKK